MQALEHQNRSNTEVENRIKISRCQSVNNILHEISDGSSSGIPREIIVPQTRFEKQIVKGD